jgi:hypothetical protein
MPLKRRPRIANASIAPGRARSELLGVFSRLAFRGVYLGLGSLFCLVQD